MKKLLLLGFAVLGLFACTPSANPIAEEGDKKLNLNISASLTAPRNGGLVEIPVEYEGEYTVQSQSYDVQVVRSKAMQNGVIVVSVTPNLSEDNRKMVLNLRYVSTIKQGGSLDYAEKNVEITQEPVAKEVLFADIAGANALYIAAQQGGVSKATSSAQKLYKIAATGAVSSVVFKDEYSDTAAVKINFIRNLSDKYVYMNLTIEPRNIEKQYVVRKTDGAVFTAKPPYIGKDTEIQTDRGQNIYYMLDGRLYKMYDYNNGVDVAQLTKDYMSIYGYLVDPKGNVWFDYNNVSTGALAEEMCYLSSGGFSRSVWTWSSSSKCRFVLKKEPENFYEIISGSSIQIIRVKCTSPALTAEVLADNIAPSYDMFYTNGDSDKRRFVLDDMTLYCGILERLVGVFTPVIVRVEDEQSYKVVELSSPRWPLYHQTLQVEGGYFYGYNNDEIFRISIYTGIVETIYANTEYSIYDFSLGSGGVITFSALELRKAQDVLCEIRDGQLKILQTDDSQKIIQLERIN